MQRFSLLFLVFTALSWAATVRLYLKDGTYQTVREYNQDGDRIRYYSIEREDWEEMPAEMVDLARSQKERRDTEASRKVEAEEADAEEKAERTRRKEIESIPVESGVFYRHNEKLQTVKQAEVKLVKDKKRSILKAMSPVPLISGKSTVEIDGLHSPFAVSEDRPEFFIRLAKEERFGIARLQAGKTARLVQQIEKIPVTDELTEKTDEVELFRQQVAEDVYKIWPTKPLAPGEYAVFEYTEGQGNLQAWDFSYKKN